MRTWVVFAAAFACGCATTDSAGDEPVTTARTFDACAPLALVSTDATALQLAGMEGAQALWRDRGAPALGRRSGVTIDVQFDDAAGAFHGRYDPDTGVIYINNDLATETMLSIVIAHELGHAFGLYHVPKTERASVMNPGNLDTAVTEEDQRAIEALWGTCD